MSVHDTIGDFITVIRNAGDAGKTFCSYPHSNLRVGIAKILKQRGFVENCSEGQRKRIALVRLSLMNRDIWILDEPTTNLDIVGKEKFLKLHTLHLRSGGLSIIASHEPAQFDGSKIINLEKHSGKN